MPPKVSVKLEVTGSAESVAAMRAFTAQAKAAGKESTQSFEGFARALEGPKQLLASLGVALTIGEIARFTKETLAAAVEQKHLAEQIGSTVGNVSAFSAVARLTNTDTKSWSAGLGILAKNIDLLKSGSATATANFGRLHLGAKDFASNDTIVNAETLAKALSHVADGESKTALMAAVAGRNGRALIPVFEKLVELGGLQGAVDFAKRTGFYVDEATVAQYAQLEERMKLLELYAQGAGLALLKGFSPALLTIMDTLSKSTDGNASAFERLGVSLGKVSVQFSKLLLHLYGWSTVIGDVLSGQFKKAGADFQYYDKLIKDLLAGSQGATTAKGGGGADIDALERKARADQLAREIDAARKQYYGDDLRMFEANWKLEADLVKQAADAGLVTSEQYFAVRRNLIAAEFKYKNDQLVHERDAAANDITDPTLRGFRVGALNDQISTNAAEQALQVAELNAEMEKAKAKTTELGVDVRGTFQNALGGFLSSGIDQVHSLSQAFDQLGMSIARSLQQIAGNRIATAFMNLIWPTQAATSMGLGDIITQAMGAFGFASGGYVRGPGGPRSDSIPARLSAGEYVMPAHVVSRPGVLSALEGARSGRFGLGGLGAHLSGARRFADGGLVRPTAAPASATIGGHVTIGLDDGLIARSIESPAGQAALIRVLGKNRRAVGSVLR